MKHHYFWGCQGCMTNELQNREQNSFTIDMSCLSICSSLLPILLVVLVQLMWYTAETTHRKQVAEQICTPELDRWSKISLKKLQDLRTSFDLPSSEYSLATSPCNYWETSGFYILVILMLYESSQCLQHSNTSLDQQTVATKQISSLGSNGLWVHGKSIDWYGHKILVTSHCFREKKEEISRSWATKNSAEESTKLISQVP